MELIKKDSDFYNLIEKQCPCYGMETGNYDLFTHKFINEIFKKDENGKYVNHSRGKWKDYIKDTDIAYIEKQIQQIAIARHPLLPDEMAKELINLKNINKGTLKSLLKRNDLTYSTIKETYDLLNKRFPYAMSELFIDSTQPEIGRDAIKILTIDAVSEISSNGKAKNIAQEYVFLYTRENRLISDWLSAEGNNIPEDILSHIASNENLLSSIRDTAFNIGCNWEKIDNFTTKISESIYPNVIAYLFNDNKDGIISTNQKIKEKLFYFSTDTLMNFVMSECLPVANRRDLLNRLINANPDYCDLLGKIFVSFIDHEKDIAILKDISSSLEFSITDNQSYLTHLLMNPEFQKTEMFDRTIDYLFINTYGNEPSNKKLVDNLIKSLYAYPSNQILQSSIISETLKNKEKEPSFDIQIKNQENVLMALLHSKYTNIETYNLLMNNKTVTPDLLLLGHLGKCCHDAYEENVNTEKVQHIKEIFFKCVKYDLKNKCFLVNINNKSEYKLVSKIIKTAKTKTPKKYLIKNKSTLSNIESLVKKHEKKIIKDELMNKLFDVERKVLDLNHKDASNFYIHISELQEEFEVVQEKLNNFKKRKAIIIDNEKDISHNDDEIR